MKAAFLVPLSGNQAALGQSLLNAAQLAVYDAGGETFALLPFDTGDNAETARKAASEALAQGANLIIGPVFTGSVEAVKPIARMANAPVLALSNNPALGDPNTFVLGLAPGGEVKRILSFASLRGIRRIAVLVPRNAYGQAIEASLREALSDNGQMLVFTQRYAPGADATLVTKELTGALTAAGGAEALLVPEGGAMLPTLAQSFAATGLAIQILGTSQWQGVDLSRLPGLNGAYYPNIPPESIAGFAKRYTETYGQNPTTLASLAYDATALAALLGGKGFDPAQLTDPNGYKGAAGPFRLMKNGSVERALAVYQVTPAGTVLVDRAPASLNTTLN